MTTDEIMKMLPTLPKMQRPERSNSLDIRLHSGDRVTGENSVDEGAWMRLLVRDNVFCSNSSSKVVAAVVDANGEVVEMLMNSNSGCCVDVSRCTAAAVNESFTCSSPSRSNAEVVVLYILVYYVDGFLTWEI